MLVYVLLNLFFDQDCRHDRHACHPPTEEPALQGTAQGFAYVDAEIERREERADRKAVAEARRIRARR